MTTIREVRSVFLGGRKAEVQIRALATGALAALLIAVAGCEKPPTFDELVHGKKPEPAPKAPVVAKPVETKPAPKPPEPPKKTPQEVLAQFNNTPPNERTNAMLNELASRKEIADQVTVVDLSHSPVNDQGIAVLPKLDHVHDLMLDYCSYGNDSLKSVGQMKSLTGLQLTNGASRDKTIDQGLTYLKDLKQLKYLKLDQTRISGVGLTPIGELPELESLSINNAMVNDSHIQSIGGLKNLKKLYMSASQITDQGLEFLEPFDDLEVLSMSNQTPNLHGTGLLKLVKAGKLKKLRELHISNAPGLEVDAYDAIARLKNLEYLNVAKSNVNDFYFKEAIATKLKKLNGLSIDGLTDGGMQFMPRLTNLVSLNIMGGPGVSDLSLDRQISKLKKLERLSLSGTGCSVEGCRKLKRKVPKLTIFLNRGEVKL